MTIVAWLAGWGIDRWVATSRSNRLAWDAIVTGSVAAGFGFCFLVWNLRR
jgi:hypothetical protein